VSPMNSVPRRTVKGIITAIDYQYGTRAVGRKIEKSLFASFFTYTHAYARAHTHTYI